MEKHNASRLVGAPPGYVGYEEGGQLTEKVRRRPYSVVLLDEIEKAHPDVFNMLLQIMEEGRLTDSFGRHVDFRNVILIMTSNLGSHALKAGAGLGFGKADQAHSVDELIIFNPLSSDDLRRIIDLQLGEVLSRLKERGVTLQLDQAASDFLIK